MRIYEAKVISGWVTDTLAVAAPSFSEALLKIKRLMRVRRRRYTILSIIQTAKLDA